MHLYLYPESTTVSPGFLHAPPALTAAIALGPKRESAKEVITIEIKWVRFIPQLWHSYLENGKPLQSTRRAKLPFMARLPKNRVITQAEED